MTPEQRLDRIERSLDVLASNQIAERESRLQLHDDLEILFQVVQRTDRSVDLLADRFGEVTDKFVQLTNKFDQLADRFDQLTGRFDQLTGRVDQLTTNVDRLTNNQAQLTQLFVQSVQRNEQDRVEIRRIWEYLLGQQQNGNGGRQG
jgi:methyl-accepting chemotaxis protein